MHCQSRIDSSRLLFSLGKRVGRLALALLLVASCGAVSRCAAAPATQTGADNSATGATPVTLAENGRALLPIEVAADATPRVRAAAATLASYLGRMSGATFAVQSRPAPLDVATPGIAIGLASGFAPPPPGFDATDPTRSEEYLLRGTGHALQIAGASELGVEDAVWDLLYRLGYRQFFPGDAWEVVPKAPLLRIAVNAFEKPAYYSRSIFFGFGALPENGGKYAAWRARNREISGIAVSTGHAYPSIISRNRAAFAAHPEYYALVNGVRDVRPSAKFCISNSGLRQLVVDDALRQFDKDPTLQSISIEPSDGGGHCECPNCAALGSITDRAVILANAVAAAVNAKYPGKFVGMYAYNQHSPPPSIAVDPHVVISIATSFIHGGFTIDQLLAGWHQHASMLGIREYYAVNGWDRDLPGRARGSNLDYLKTTIPKFHDEGARFLAAESSDSWGPNGLGYYLTSRLLWNPGEAGHIDELVNDFLDKAFGPARAPMAHWYRLIDGSTRPLVSTDLVGRMYRDLSDALRLTDDPAIRARLYDLALYTRYVELFDTYTRAAGPARQAAFEDVMRYAWRIRGTEMVHTLALWRDLPTRDKQVQVPAEAGYRVPEPANPWKSSVPYTAAQIDQFIADGIAHNPLLAFQAVSYSDDLVPATPLHLDSQGQGRFDYTRGLVNYYTWANAAPATVPLLCRAGIIYTNLGDAHLSLYPRAQTLGQAVDEVTCAPDKTDHQLLLKTPLAGLARLEVSDDSAATALDWKPGTAMVIESSLEHPARLFNRWSLYFYVPKGTRVVGGYGAGEATLLDASGAVAGKLDIAGDYWSVAVPAGQDGKLWKFANVSGQFELMTVPPYLARSANELMLPSEVVKADAGP